MRRNIHDPIVENMRQTMDRQANNLARIIDELLDVNRVARGQFTIEPQVVDLREVATRAVETSRSLIESKKHILEMQLPDQPVVVKADPMRFQQVLINLLNNAAKYTPEGGSISLRVAVEDDGAVICVRDNGKGIERTALERVFDFFILLEPNSASALGGLGVGLALVRRIVELHGGRVQAKSDGAGRGAEFIVRMPVSESPLVQIDAAIRTLLNELTASVDETKDQVSKSPSMGA